MTVIMKAATCVVLNRCPFWHYSHTMAAGTHAHTDTDTHKDSRHTHTHKHTDSDSRHT